MTPVSIILGLPHGLTDLCRDICVDLSGQLGQPARGVEISRSADPSLLDQPVDCLGSLADAMIAAVDEHIVAVSRTPDRAFVAAIVRSRRSFLIVLDDPRFLALQAGGDGGLFEAIRAFSLSGACLLGAVGTGTAVVLTPRDFVAPSQAVLGNLLSLLGHTIDERTLSTAARVVATHVLGSGLERRSAVEAELRGARSKDQLIAVEGALGGYATAFTGRELERIVATRSLFLSADTMAPMEGAVIDATGRARLLFLGPYLSIPAGSWSLRVVMAFSQELANFQFSMDAIRERAGVITEIGRVSFAPGIGPYTAQITFEHREPDSRLEFRLAVDKSVFDGRVSLGYAELIRLDRAQGTDPGSAIEWNPS